MIGTAICLRLPGHLAQIVDRGRVAIRSAERAEILHAAGRSPPERVTGPPGRVRTPGDLAQVVDPPATAGRSAKRAQIGHQACAD
jgi:hypothetical protein